MRAWEKRFELFSELPFFYNCLYPFLVDEMNFINSESGALPGILETQR